LFIECDRLGGINLSQGICDQELPLPIQLGAQEAMTKLSTASPAMMVFLNYVKPMPKRI
jgi:hypothetical protein